jgi:Pyridoxamine 5'-phosphate oxidase
VTQPSARNARFPAEYGDPGDSALVPWSDVEDKLRAASNYWLATVNPYGRAHVRPVDGVWVDGALCFGGSDETRWVRNLQANRAVTVNLASEAEAIILEGAAELITDPKHPLARPSAEASVKKYPQSRLRLDPRRLPPLRHPLALRLRPETTPSGEVEFP